MGDLDPRRAEIGGERDHARHVARILTMDDEVAGQRQARRLDEPRGRDLPRLRTRHPADPLGLGRIRVLKGELDMVEPRIRQSSEPFLIEQDTGGDEIGIEAGIRRRADQHGQIGARHRLPAREMQMQDAERRGFGENPLPIFGGQFLAGRCQAERVGAVGALQGTAMGDLRHQRHWRRGNAHATAPLS